MVLDPRLGGGLGPNMVQLGRTQVCPVCPQNDVHFVVFQMPSPGAIATSQARCIICNTYWEVSPIGQIIRMQRTPGIDCCTKCYEPSANTGVGYQHTCYHLRDRAIQKGE